MLDQPITSKMIAQKDGAIGRLIFNNPARHNAVSLEMWEAVAPHHRRFRARRRDPGHRRQRRRRPRLRLGRRHLRIQGEARLRGGSGGL